jgi:hypothetical protein
MSERLPEDTQRSRDVRWLEPVCWDTQQVRPCSSHGFPTRDGPCKRLQPAGITRSRRRDGPRGDLRHPHAARSRLKTVPTNASSWRASLAANCLSACQDVSSRRMPPNTDRATVRGNNPSTRRARQPACGHDVSLTTLRSRRASRSSNSGPGSLSPRLNSSSARPWNVSKGASDFCEWLRLENERRK